MWHVLRKPQGATRLPLQRRAPPPPPCLRPRALPAKPFHRGVAGPLSVPPHESTSLISNKKLSKELAPSLGICQDIFAQVQQQQRACPFASTQNKENKGIRGIRHNGKKHAGACVGKASRLDRAILLRIGMSTHFDLAGAGIHRIFPGIGCRGGYRRPSPSDCAGTPMSTFILLATQTQH